MENRASNTFQGQGNGSEPNGNSDPPNPAFMENLQLAINQLSNGSVWPLNSPLLTPEQGGLQVRTEGQSIPPHRRVAEPQSSKTSRRRNSRASNRLPSQSFDFSAVPTPTQPAPPILTNEQTWGFSQPRNIGPPNMSYYPPNLQCPFNNFPYGTGIFPGIPPPIDRDPEYLVEISSRISIPNHPLPLPAHTTPFHPPRLERSGAHKRD
nr:expressed protein [Hymenolepis microstoma]